MARPSPSPTPSLSSSVPFHTLSPEPSYPPSYPSPRSNPLLQNLYHCAHLVLTTLSALFGLVILATSAHTLHVYNETTLGTAFHLPIWPQSFDLRPTIAGVVCGAVVFVMNLVMLVGLFVPALSRLPPSVSTFTILLPLSISLIAAIIGIAIPLNALTSSAAWSLQSWSCQWFDINTTSAPHWGSLCMESRAAGVMSACVVGFEGLLLLLVVGKLAEARGRGRWMKMGGKS